MASVTMVDKAVALVRKQQGDHTCTLFRVHFGKRIFAQPVGLTSEGLEYVLAEGGDFTPAERAWLDVFTEGYSSALEAFGLAQVTLGTKRRY